MLPACYIQRDAAAERHTRPRWVPSRAVAVRVQHVCVIDCLKAFIALNNPICFFKWKTFSSQNGKSIPGSKLKNAFPNQNGKIIFGPKWKKANPDQKW